MISLPRRVVIAALLFALAACSGRQVYQSALGWRQGECQKMLDSAERARCMESAGKDYDTYSKERGVMPDNK
jgi:Flp pilus assembly protein TadD